MNASGASFLMADECAQWLEAAVFFTCSASVDSENADRWTHLAVDRLNSYEMSMSGLESYIDEYRSKQ